MVNDGVLTAELRCDSTEINGNGSRIERHRDVKYSYMSHGTAWLLAEAKMANPILRKNYDSGVQSLHKREKQFSELGRVLDLQVVLTRTSRRTGKSPLMFVPTRDAF